MRSLVLASAVILICVGCAAKEETPAAAGGTPQTLDAKGGAAPKMKGMDASSVGVTTAGASADANAGSKLGGK